ncbi:hypothetical protein [Flavisphingomonas formosensis]|uniref:hypothetical protein n=1 Tax=Flavisphingomonas formosensis TaxID=861534 RepID=UPI0012F72C1E|nr:hypothetical protein [Sphingomonas formosensis]
MIIDVAQSHVTKTCATHEALISSIETLPGGYTRVVLQSGHAAAVIRRIYADKVVTAAVPRTPLSVAGRGVPLTQEMTGRPAGAFGPRTPDRKRK